MNPKTVSDKKANQSSGRNSLRVLWIGIVVILVLIAAAVAAIIVVRRTETRYLEIGRARINSGDWGAAVAALDQALNTQPDFVIQHRTEATALRGLGYYQLGDNDAAMADFEIALEADPGLVDLYAFRADLYYQLGEYKAALKDSEAALEHSELLSDYLLGLIHADRAEIYRSQNLVEEFMDESDAAFEYGSTLPDETIAQFYASRAQITFEAGNMEESLNESLAALDYEEALSDDIRAGLLANLAMIYYQEGLLDLAMESSDAALDFDSLSEESLGALLSMRAGARLQMGDLDGAISEASEAVTGGQDAAMIHALLALQNYRQGDYASALAEANSALAIDPDSALSFRVRGSVFAWQGKIEEALADLAQALKLNKLDVEALAVRVYAHLELNDLEAAEVDMERARELKPAAPATLWAEAQIDIYNYDFAKARALMDLAIEGDDSRPEFYTWRATTYRLTNGRGQAIADLEQALALDDNFPQALAGLMSMQARQFDFENYQEEANRLVELYPEWHIGYDTLAYYHGSIQDDKELSLRYNEQVLKFRPESTIGYLNRAYSYLEDEAYDLAQTDFERALELRPNSLEAAAGLADLYWAQEEYDQALQYLDQILTVLPDSTNAMVSRAEIFYAQGDLERAWQYTHQALAYDPDDPQALLMRSNLYMDSGEVDLAQLDLNRILSAFPSYAWAHYNQARAYYLQGKPEKVREAAEKALSLAPKMSHPYLLLMFVGLDEEDADEAERQVNKWIESEPEAAAAHFWLGSIYNYQGNYQEAEASLTTVLELAGNDDPLLGDYYLERAVAYIGAADEELAEVDLLTAIENTIDLEILDKAEITLANPGMRAISVAGRRLIEDQDLGYTISFDESWTQLQADPAQGYVLSLGYGQGEIEASADVYLIDDWDPSFSAYDLASVIDPTEGGAQTGPLVTVRIGDQSGLMRAYEFEELGRLLIGRQYILVQGDRAAIFILLAEDKIYEQFEAEFDALAASFAFLP